MPILQPKWISFGVVVEHHSVLSGSERRVPRVTKATRLFEGRAQSRFVNLLGNSLHEPRAVLLAARGSVG